MRFLSIIILSLFIITFSQAQNSIDGLGIAYAHGSNAFDPSLNRIGGESVSVELSSFDLEKMPVEFSTELVFGNGSEISFSWKFKSAYVVETFEYSFFKVGIGAGEMLSKNYIGDAGGLISRFTEEEGESSFGRFVVSPYLEWEHEPIDGLSFFARTSFDYYSKSESHFNGYDEPKNSEEVGLFYAGFKPAFGVKFGF